MKSIKILAAKIFLLIVLLFGKVLQPAYADMPVFDWQNAITIGQQLSSLQQQYQVLTNQYQAMQQNLLQPFTNTWSNPSTIMSQFQGTMNSLPQFSNGGTSSNISNFLSNFPTLSSYTNNACASNNSCTPAQLATLQNTQITASNAQMSANTASLQTIEQQQTAVQNDANTLEQLQTNAQSATGQLQAAGYANQIAAQQANQLLQMRQLMITQQNAETTRNIALSNRQDQQDAADKLLNNTSSLNAPSSGRSW